MEVFCYFFLIGCVLCVEVKDICFKCVDFGVMIVKGIGLWCVVLCIGDFVLVVR